VSGRRAGPATLLVYATRSGGTTLDSGAGGGNPFASALIEAAEPPGLPLRELPRRLRTRTADLSGGHQAVEWLGETALRSWRFPVGDGPTPERRTALVLVVSDYSAVDQAASLTGAAHDERRVAAMLARHGFSVDQGVGPRRAELRRAIQAFRRRSETADVAVIYSTGHGVESDGTVYLLPGDYPVGGGFAKGQLRRFGVSVTQLVGAACARGQNLVFFAGCRTLVSPVTPPDLSRAPR